MGPYNLGHMLLGNCDCTQIAVVSYSRVAVMGVERTLELFDAQRERLLGLNVFKLKDGAQKP